MSTDKEFELGVVTVKVTTIDGGCSLEDWDPADAEAARVYAEQTAYGCDDVVKVAYYNAETQGRLLQRRDRRGRNF